MCGMLHPHVCGRNALVTASSVLAANVGGRWPWPCDRAQHVGMLQALYRHRLRPLLSSFIVLELATLPDTTYQPAYVYNIFYINILDEVT